MLNNLYSLLKTTGFFYLTPGMVLMWCIGFVLIYLAIKKDYEPLLLLPIGFGILLANLPLADLMKPESGLLWKFYQYGIHWEIIPTLICNLVS
jgi:oxaloacetate decarboxylase beta subunit